MSNNCVKTGAVVWMEPYRATYRGDAYAIGDVMVLRGPKEELENA